MARTLRHAFQKAKHGISDAWAPLRAKLAGVKRTAEDAEDFLLVTFDACRYDAFLAAKKTVLGEYGEAKRSYAMGTYTLPAHIAMFQGFLPHVFEPAPFYNRYCRQLWRISHRNIDNPPLVTFAGGTKNIICGFQERGYFTVGLGAMDWFRDSAPLREGFDFFRHTGTDGRAQVELLVRQIQLQAKGRAFFGFINFGETHSPYRHADMPRNEEMEKRYAVRRIFNQRGTKLTDWEFDKEGFAAQVACTEFLDARMGDIITFLKQRGRPTTVVICGDHGECFGEDGMYTHGFYHEKVMEVPLLIFRLNAPPHETEKRG